MKILVLDNYDSFTYNLVHYIENIPGVEVDVFRNDEISLDQVEAYDKIILSPGPGLPEEAGVLKALIQQYAPTKPILGVCLGQQAIAEVYGGKLLNLEEVYHGVATEITQLENDEKLFKGIPKSFLAGRYHSWVVDKSSLPECLTVTAEDTEGNIMALKHNEYELMGVQFHPESILTTHGEQMIKNFIEN